MAILIVSELNIKLIGLNVCEGQLVIIWLDFIDYQYTGCSVTEIIYLSARLISIWHFMLKLNVTSLPDEQWRHSTLVLLAGERCSASSLYSPTNWCLLLLWLRDDVMCDVRRATDITAWPTSRLDPNSPWRLTQSDAWRTTVALTIQTRHQHNRGILNA